MSRSKWRWGREGKRREGGGVKNKVEDKEGGRRGGGVKKKEANRCGSEKQTDGGLQRMRRDRSVSRGAEEKMEVIMKGGGRETVRRLLLLLPFSFSFFEGENRRAGERKNEAKQLEGSSSERTSHLDESLPDEAINCWAVAAFHSPSGSDNVRLYAASCLVRAPY